MKRIQLLGITMVLGLSAASALAQPVAPAAPEDPKAMLQRLENERLQRQVEDQKRVQARREEGWQRTRKYLRDDLGRSGFGDRAVQNAIIDFVVEQDLAREEVRVAAAACYRALDDHQLDDPDIQKLLDTFQAAAAKAQVAREASLKQLDAQIRWSSTPRLKMFLILRGLIGNESQFVASTLPDSGLLMERYELRQLFPAPPAPAPVAE